MDEIERADRPIFMYQTNTEAAFVSKSSKPLSTNWYLADPSYLNVVKLSKLTLILEILQNPEVFIYFKWKLPFISLEPQLIRHVCFPI